MPRPNKGYTLKSFANRPSIYIRWFEGGRERVKSTLTGDWQEANGILAEFIKERERKSHPHLAENVLINDVLQDYMEEKAPDALDTARIIDACYPLGDYFEYKYASQITPQECVKYGNSRKHKKTGMPIAVGTIRRELGTLQAALNHAYQERRINIPIPVSKPKSLPSKDLWLTKNEVLKLIDAAEELPKSSWYLPLYIRIAYYTGRRKGAILALRWHQVDFINNQIDFRDLEHSETAKKRGRIPIPKKLLPFLKKASQFGDPMTYVVSETDGRHIQDIKKSFESAVKLAGITRVTPHTLKHTTITHLLQAGLSSKEVSDLTATSMQTIEKTYGHHCPDHLQLAANTL